jgi:tetratricopeptide (TPR) repeat protein
MSLNSPQIYLRDPLYQDAMRHIHVGKWEDGLGKLTQLREKYPDSDDLEDLMVEMQMRAGMDDEEVMERHLRRRQRLKKLSIRLVILGVVVCLVFLGVRVYSNWIQLRWNLANRSVEEQVQQVELAMKFRQAQNLMLTGQGEMAESIFQQIAAINPAYPGLQDALQQSDAFVELNSKYDQALKLLEANNYLSALSLFEEIETEDPQFKDVSTQITDLKQRIFITDTQAQAERAFDKQDWDEAIAAYETIRITNPDFNPDLIELRLYESYLSAGLQVLDASTGRIEDLETAESYFRKALSLKPQDAGLQEERKQAREAFGKSLSSSYFKAAQQLIVEKANSLPSFQTAEEYLQRALEIRPNDLASQALLEQVGWFLQAQQEFERGYWDQAIAFLESLYIQDPYFADGAARQTLYEAYLGRGKEFMLNDKYELALKDFERAAELAEESALPTLQVKNAQANIADAMGALGRYEEAVLLYNTLMEGVQLNEANLENGSEVRARFDHARSFDVKGGYARAFEIYRDVIPLVLISDTTLVDYEVQPGDYLSSLANHFNTTIQAIEVANGMNASDLLHAGDVLVIPSVKS